VGVHEEGGKSHSHAATFAMDVTATMGHVLFDTEKGFAQTGDIEDVVQSNVVTLEGNIDVAHTDDWCRGAIAECDLRRCRLGSITTK